MKKITFTFVFVLMMSVLGLQAQSWSADTYGFSLTPATANLGIGTTALTNAKLRLTQNDATNTGTLYNLYATSSVSNANSTGTLYGAYLSASKTNTNSSGTVYGIYSSNSNYSQTGSIYGLYTSNYNYNASAGTVYGNYTYGYNANTNGTVYGVYSSVSGASATKKWAGYFTGGDVYVSGNVGIGTNNPQYKLHVNDKLRVTGDIYGSQMLTFADDTRFTVTSAEIPNLREPSFSMTKYGIGVPLVTYSADLWISGNNAIRFFTAAVSTPRMSITFDGNVGIGITAPTAKLDVAGTIRAHEVKVCLNQGCDYVFDKNYNLMSISDVADYVKTNKHLPNVAPAAEMESEGINLSEMNALLLRKVEELTLYVIELKGEIDELKKK